MDIGEQTGPGSASKMGPPGYVECRGVRRRVGVPGVGESRVMLGGSGYVVIASSFLAFFVFIDSRKR